MVAPEERGARAPRGRASCCEQPPERNEEGDRPPTTRGAGSRAPNALSLRNYCWSWGTTTVAFCTETAPPLSLQEMAIV